MLNFLKRILKYFAIYAYSWVSGLRVVLEYEEFIGFWAAYCPEMQGITSCGSTQEEAVANFKEAAELFFESSYFSYN